jgi:hypothetical protein
MRRIGLRRVNRPKNSAFRPQRRFPSARHGPCCVAVDAVPAMPMTVQHERENIFRVDVNGLLRTSEFEHGQEVLRDEMRRLGPVRLLFVLTAFEGWEPHDDWRDLSFYVSHGDAIERIAIVGDERWRSESLMFASADLRKAPVEFFSPEQLTGARDWLSA